MVHVGNLKQINCSLIYLDSFGIYSKNKHNPKIIEYLANRVNRSLTNRIKQDNEKEEEKKV